MRALLVVNPVATVTTPRVRDVLVSALSSGLTLEIAQTKGRGHAAELGERAVETGADVVVVLGGDGTVNEVVNGLLRGGPGPDCPALAVVPGGGTNVFARALGFSRYPVEATGELLEALREGHSRPIGLGRAADRWFTFCAGLGLDGVVVRQVEAKRTGGRRNTPGLYLRSAVGRFYGGYARRRPPLMLEAPTLSEPAPVFLGLVCNTSPWTYLRDRPVVPCPEASFDTGLDVLAMRRLGTARTLHATAQMLRDDGRGPHGKHVLTIHDLPEMTISAEEPLALQVDGEYLGDHTSVRFVSAPRALRIIAPSPPPRS